MRQRREEGFTANPGEYFYTDPLLSPGQRVYNCLSPASHQVMGCLRLQTPPPIMSSCVFPSSYDDDPMGDDEDISENISHNGGPSELPLLPPGSDPLDMVAPQCLVLPVSGCCGTVSAVPSPALYTPSELEAVCGLLCLSATSPPHRAQ
ncbi:histone deacetylase complex subunit SAP25 [Bufo bufo]|uniref:histone deacetylase complex subunit SAP25 n=1 Tax=Bufo bufo TaxID=8384 RepID=UPI001ABE2358|nr:histone deacetylase complex subunit SAP25 [Bufo bufo]